MNCFSSRRCCSKAWSKRWRTSLFLWCLSLFAAHSMFGNDWSLTKHNRGGL